MTPMQGVSAVDDPDSERAQAEARATQSANLKLAADQRRRRGQNSLIARGGIEEAAEFIGPTQGYMGPVQGYMGPIAPQQTSRRPSTPLIRWGR